MKVRLLTQGGYEETLITPIGSIVEADKYGDTGYLCHIKSKTGASKLFFTKDEVEVVNEQTDTIVESVINQFRERSEVGIKKYGVTLDRTDLSTLDWISHAQQEAMDFVLYLEKLKQTL
jgi:hypothetical protein